MIDSSSNAGPVFDDDVESTKKPSRFREGFQIVIANFPYLAVNNNAKKAKHDEAQEAKLPD